MAVTFLQSPQEYNPSDNNVQWVFSSNQTGQPNFEYKIELLINSVVVYVGKVFPIQGAVAYFNAAEILRGLVPAPNILSNPVVSLGDASQLSFLNNSVRTVALKVTERYGNPIANQANATSGAVKVWKAALSEEQWLGFDHALYQVNSPVRLFMTNFPRNRDYYVTTKQNNYLQIIGDFVPKNVFNYATGQAPTLAAFEAQIGFPLINGYKFGDTIVFDNEGYVAGDFNFFDVGLTGFLKCSAINIGDGSFANNQITHVHLPLTTTLGLGSFQSNQITHVHLPLATFLGESCFFNNQITNVYLPLANNLSDSCFENNQITHVHLPLATFLGAVCFQSNQITHVYLPLANNLSGACFADNSIQYFNAPIVQNIGETTGDNGVFSGNTGNTVQVFVPLIHQTSNGGGLEGDLADLDANNTVTFNWGVVQVPSWINQPTWITEPFDDLFLRYITLDDADEIEIKNGLQFINTSMKYLNTVNGSNIERFLTVWVRSNNIEISERLTFKVLKPCNEHRTVFFLNKLGGVDSWTFTARKQVNRTFERSEYQKKLGRLVNGVYVYDSFDGRIQNYHNRSTAIETVDSDWLFPDVHAWLVRELLESPLVWTEDENGNKTRYVIQNSSSSEGQDRTDIWMKLSLEMKPTLQSYSATL